MANQSDNSKKNSEGRTGREMILMSVANFLAQSWWHQSKSLKSRFKGNNGAKLGFIYGFIHGFFGRRYDNSGASGQNKSYREAFIAFYELGYIAGQRASRKHFQDIALAIDQGLVSMWMNGMK